MLKTMMAATTALLVISGEVAFAQTATASAPSIAVDRITRIGLDSSETERLGQSLFDSVGSRLTGSPDLKRGNDWLVQTYKSFGIDARNEKIGTWRGWRRG